MRPLASRLLLLACARLAVVPATAAAASPPKVTSVAPLKLRTGDRLTIRGAGFLAGNNRNTVVFKASGERAVFAKAASATKTTLVVKVPAKLASFPKLNAGQPVGTRFQIRVLAKSSAGRARPWASRRPSLRPRTRPARPRRAPRRGRNVRGAAGRPGADPHPVRAVPGQRERRPSRQRGRGRHGQRRRARSRVNPCVVDTDGDGMIDGYEYESARDLNAHSSNTSGRPYPGKRPWPNPLDGTDRNDDFDGDGLTLSEEYRLWWCKGHTFPVSE